MSRKPLDLPDIEDATLRACLAPLMDAMQTFADTGAPPDPDAGEAANTVEDPASLAQWRAAADEEYDVYRTIERFLAMTDADLEVAASAYPRQFAGTAARIGRFKARLEARYEAVAAAHMLLRRALDRVAGPGFQDPDRSGQG